MTPMIPMTPMTPTVAVRPTCRRRWLAGLLLLLATAAAAGADEGDELRPAGDTWQRAPEYLALVFSKTAGFRHASIPDGVAALQQLAAVHGFGVEATENAAAFNDANLARFACVVFLSTTGDVLDDEQQAAFERYIQAGGGFVGIHAASDTEYDWPWYGQLVGAYFDGHPAVQDATIIVADATHPSTAHLPQQWPRHDEWYDFQDNPRGQVHVLATLDESTYDGGGMGDDHPIAWCHAFDGGRAWYTGGGHTSESFTEPAFLEHLHGGIRWAAGRETCATGATIDAYYDKIVLDDNVTDPMDLAVATDGRVIFIERGGVVKIWKPNLRASIVAGFLEVFDELEDGLLGIALDPRFDLNHWVYLYYSPAGDEPINRLSRFTLAGDELDNESEHILLEVTTQRETCCHSGGSLTFDGDGNLFLSTGDNTTPFMSSGFAPIDERPGHSAMDAQRTSANTHDLRGKILRITPLPEGTYAIPEGNLFPPNGMYGRPEIYVMGCRNPFRISVDRKSGALYWGEVGPDATAANPLRGPAGHDEFNRATGPGNFGWPYCIAENLPYRDYDFQAQVSGPAFDCEHPVNSSPNNTGVLALPPARPAWIAYRYDGEEGSVLGAGGRCAMAGPVYHYDPAVKNNQRLPSYFDNTLFLYEWARNWICAVRLDAGGEPVSIARFLDGLEFVRPMDMEIGPDGGLYMIEWGTGFGGGNPDARVIRIDYFPDGERPPVAAATGAPMSGPTPLRVSFSAEGSVARAEPTRLEYAWDFDGDGRADSAEADPEHVFGAPGTHAVQLTVTDARGRSGVANLTVTAGNTRPHVAIDWPPAGGFVAFGDTIRYDLSVHDPEDVRYDADRLELQALLGHDTHAHPLHTYTGFTGRVETLRDEGHGADADLFTVLAATYTDLGRPDEPGAEALSARAEIVLQPKRKQAEYAAETSGARLEKTGDPDGGGQEVVLDGPGSAVVFAPVNLHGIDAVRLRVGAGAPGAVLALHVNGPDGPLLGRATIAPEGGHRLTAGRHPFRIEHFEAGGGAGLILRWSGPGFAKRVVEARALSRDGAGHAPGANVTFYALEGPSRLPDFDALEPIASGTVEAIDFPSTDGPLGPGALSDNFGAVFTGFIDVPADGTYAFFLESDDGSRMYVDGAVMVEHDGLHGMSEASTPDRWDDAAIAVTDPGGTHALYVVCESGENVKLNWLEFVGRGVAEAGGRGAVGGHDHAP